MRTCVIFNPTAKGDKARRFQRQLEAIGREAVLMRTTGPNHATALAAAAVRDGFELIVAAGGDGTLNEVLNGIAAEPDGCERACLGVLPLGTVNVFARELAIPLRPDRAWATIRECRETRVDLARAEFAGPRGREVRYFSQLAGAGLDARAVELVDWGTKKLIGPLAYIIAGLKALAHPPPQITVSAGTTVERGELVLLGNGRLYGGNFRVFPDADLRDGRMDICVFPKTRWSTLLWCGPRLVTLFNLPPKAVRRLQAAAFTLDSPQRTPFQVDGELVGHLPANITMERGRLRVRIP